MTKFHFSILTLPLFFAGCSKSKDDTKPPVVPTPITAEETQLLGVWNLQLQRDTILFTDTAKATQTAEHAISNPAAFVEFTSEPLTTFSAAGKRLRDGAAISQSPNTVFQNAGSKLEETEIWYVDPQTQKLNIGSGSPSYTYRLTGNPATGLELKWRLVSTSQGITQIVTLSFSR